MESLPKNTPPTVRLPPSLDRSPNAPGPEARLAKPVWISRCETKGCRGARHRVGKTQVSRARQCSGLDSTRRRLSLPKKHTTHSSATAKPVRSPNAPTASQLRNSATPGGVLRSCGVGRSWKVAPKNTPPTARLPPSLIGHRIRQGPGPGSPSQSGSAGVRRGVVGAPATGLAKPR